MKARMLMVAAVVLAMSGLAAGVTAEVVRDAELRAVELPYAGTMQAGAKAEYLGEQGGWYKLRVEKFVGYGAVNAFAKSGNELCALRETAIYAAERPVVGHVADGNEVEATGAVAGCYVVRVRVQDEDGEERIVEGLVEPGALRETDALKALATRAASEAAEARETERLYALWRFRYAKVAGEYVRVPEFDLRRVSSNPQGGMQLPTWEVGEFGHVPVATVKQVFGPESLLAELRIYKQVAVTVSGGGTFNPHGLRGMMGTVMMERTHKAKVLLVGWPTGELADGHLLWSDRECKRADAWIAVIGNYTYHTPIGAKVTVLRAIPLAQVRRGLTREEFNELRELKKKESK